MDNDENFELDQLLARVRESAFRSLAEVIDVEQRLNAIRQACAAQEAGTVSTKTSPTSS
ncbi:hypothetical protein AB0M43_36525 [Longispora sp. NPDC051575]|uniref:hypothetical protein n=1 Tax=Longispora sp. NPDC051575 TaxID=3154943 RepID=UPI00342A9641